MIIFNKIYVCQILFGFPGTGKFGWIYVQCVCACRNDLITNECNYLRISIIFQKILWCFWMCCFEMSNFQIIWYFLLVNVLFFEFYVSSFDLFSKTNGYHITLYRWSVIFSFCLSELSMIFVEYSYGKHFSYCAEFRTGNFRKCIFDGVENDMSFRISKHANGFEMSGISIWIWRVNYVSIFLV